MTGRAYHRYFEGYSERKVWDPAKKKYRTESYYSGDYYRAQLSKEEREQTKKAYIAGYAAAAAVFLLVSVIKTPGNASAVNAVSSLAIILGLLWQLPSLLTCLRAKELLVMREYRERNNFLSLSMGLSCIFLVGAASHIGSAIWLGSAGDPLEWLTVAGHLLGAGIFYRIFRKGKGIVYRTVPNEAKIPDDCCDIR